jgi:hypothetical protein
MAPVWFVVVSLAASLAAWVVELEARRVRDLQTGVWIVDVPIFAQFFVINQAIIFLINETGKSFASCFRLHWKIEQETNVFSGRRTAV